MELTKFYEKGEKKKPIPKGLSYFLTVSESEAHALIVSLSTQLLNRSPNSGRKEFWTDEGEYFTIGVDVGGEKKKGSSGCVCQEHAP